LDADFEDERIERIRKHIDRLDSILVNSLGERIALMPIFAKHKKINNLPLDDEKRFTQQINRLKKVAQENSLDPEFVEEIFSLIINESRKCEKKYYLREGIENDIKY